MFTSLSSLLIIISCLSSAASNDLHPLLASLSAASLLCSLQARVLFLRAKPDYNLFQNHVLWTFFVLWVCRIQYLNCTYTDPTTLSLKYADLLFAFESSVVQSDVWVKLLTQRATPELLQFTEGFSLRLNVLDQMKVCVSVSQ